ncbi:MAG: tetratricopeptide repeat protein [candidate division Zixibacteria bacterium]|nr:tetratricopeptide repeat protein [candidate division Zixibacteria bacterium]MDH3938960.1 tetratricopeptide repeat protein [candidate division Zixibacteria bacterium]MDH4035847.1 tetratricopeptide repeat protein [candidate division Zixibacteria bacterium]
MYDKVKLTKRQIKEDKFTAFMLKARTWFIDNWQLAVIGVAAVVLIAVAGVYYSRSQAAQSEEAATRFARALLDYRNGSNQVAIMGFSQVVDEYSSDEAAEQATFLLGKVNYKIRNYEEATRYFEMYLTQYRENRLSRGAAQAGIASCHEEQAAYAEAADRFQKAFDEYPDGPLGGDYLAGAMRNHFKTGDLEKAAANLDTIKVRYKGSELVNRAIRSFAENSPGK